MSSKQAKADIPTYRRHKARNLAVVTLNGIDYYLGRYGSPESKAEYDRIINEWLVLGRRPPAKVNATGPLVKELILGYHSHLAETSPDIADKVVQALRVVREMYGETEAAKFGPVAFKAIRLKLMTDGLAVSTIRDRMGVIRRLVAWGTENELLPADALQRIKAVGGLRVGRDKVKPSKKVQPAPEADIQAILPHVGPVVRAMIELQVLTGMRPQEIRLIRTGWIDRTGELWIYRPVRHKTAGLGKVREIPLGPKAQEVLRPWLKADPDAPLFSPGRESCGVPGGPEGPSQDQGPTVAEGPEEEGPEAEARGHVHPGFLQGRDRARVRQGRRPGVQAEPDPARLRDQDPPRIRP
jgi:integrase